MSTYRFSNREVAQRLAAVAARLQILDANRFRVLAFENAAESIRTLPISVSALQAEGKLRTIPGVGEGIAEALDELFITGRVAEFDALTAQVPDGVVELLAVPDLGPKRARRLWEELGILGIDELQAAADAGRLRNLKGFGAKSEEKILRGIERLARRGEERTPIGAARPLALSLVDGLRRGLPVNAIERLAVAGSLRRWKETVGDVDILVVSRLPAAVMGTFRSLPQVADVAAAGETKTSVVLVNGLQVDLRVVEPQHWGAALQYFTGSKEHNVELRELALRQGWSLNEYGLTATGRGDAPAGEERFFADEEDLYRFLGLAPVPPELRENRGEIAAAREGRLPELIELGDLRGELHGHTTYSDGEGSLAEMAVAARARGYSYWSASDHSIGLGIVAGVDGEKLRRQAAEIEAFNQSYAGEQVDFRLLKSCEVEVLADGSLGLADDLLAALDLAVASIHSALRQERDTITERCLRAVRHPLIDILGHPTGRLLGVRPPSELDVEAVLRACVETGTIVEINAHPSRLDLSDVYARRAVELGCKIAINSDAHAVDGMEVMEYGIATARRAWLTPADVVNTRPLPDLLPLLKRRRHLGCE